MLVECCLSLFEISLSHFAPFQKLERGENIDADGGDANCPFGIRCEGEPGSQEEQDA